MEKREVRGLRWARALRGRPSCIPVGRARGIKALGVRYERELAKELREAKRGVWFEFEDSKGHGFCQVDFLMAWGPKPPRPLVIEVKHTWTKEAREELERLYLPIVWLASGREPLGVVICKRLVPEAPWAVHDLESAALCAAPLHWIGKGPLLRRPFGPPLVGEARVSVG